MAASLLAISIFALPSSASPGLPLKQIADLELPGNATRLDYQSLDPGRHLLFIAHLGDSEVIAVDTKARRVVATTKGISDVHGVLVVPELHTVYASATGTNEIVAIDERTFKVVARESGGVYPDGIAFDPITRRIFVSDEHGRTDTVIDTRTNKRVATIELGGDVGNTQYDSASHRIFANVQTLRQLVEIDPAKAAVIKLHAGSGVCRKPWTAYRAAQTTCVYCMRGERDAPLDGHADDARRSKLVDRRRSRRTRTRPGKATAVRCRGERYGLDLQRRRSGYPGCARLSGAGSSHRCGGPGIAFCVFSVGERERQTRSSSYGTAGAVGARRRVVLRSPLQGSSKPLALASTRGAFGSTHRRH